MTAASHAHYIERHTRACWQSPRQYVPDQSCDGDICVRERALAEESRLRQRRADERAQDPAHLNADERVDHKPQAKKCAMTHISLDQGPVKSAEQELRRKA